MDQKDNYGALGGGKAALLVLVAELAGFQKRMADMRRACVDIADIESLAIVDTAMAEARVIADRAHEHLRMLQLAERTKGAA
jgi:hypothetical protein